MGISLHNDAVAVEIALALRAERINPILLRGPAIARRLYGDAAVRTYIDVDLMVSQEDLSRAEEVLSRLGFADHTLEGVIVGDRPTHAHTWVRLSDGAALDLHYTLLGADAPADEVWRVLREHVEQMTVHDSAVTVLDPAALAVVVALHAAQHGTSVEQPRDDLARALELLPAPVWEAASALAARLDATAAFATGLRLLPPGEELASRLGLPVKGSTETVLRASTPPPTALGFDWLARTPGIRAKAALGARKIAPDAAFMRAWSPLARRGRLGLGAAYVWRIFWLVRHAGPGFIAWKRARRN